MPRSNDDIRDSVATAYAKAVTHDSNHCGCGTGCAEPESTTRPARTCYQPEEITHLPEDAIRHSLGCGNPLAYVEIKDGDTVLDLGSGAGIDILLAADRVGPNGRVIGVDMTDEMIAKANENIAAAGVTNVEVRKGFIEALPVESNSVDWVISNCVINLSPEKDRVFGEIARVLKPGGRMLVSDIVVENLPDELRHNGFLYSGCVAGAISESQYVAGLEAAGLSDVKVKNRVLYDSQQIASAIDNELDAVQKESDHCCRPKGCVEPHDVAESLVGGIWSCQFSARKPAGV